jgi:uncharacterized protein (TIGR02145 family)
MRKSTFSFIFIPVFSITSILNAQTVKIGNQVWMTQNLNVDKFRNGDPIPEVKSLKEWEAYAKAGKPAWCYYDNDPKNGEIYGKLYNWYAVNDPRGLAPKGWHIPSLDEMIILDGYLGDKETGTKLKSKTGWGTGGKKGSNKSGFSALPGGMREGSNLFNPTGTFSTIGYWGFWWMSFSENSYTAWRYHMARDEEKLMWRDADKSYGYSVRCIRD